MGERDMGDIRMSFFLIILFFLFSWTLRRANKGQQGKKGCGSFQISFFWIILFLLFENLTRSKNSKMNFFNIFTIRNQNQKLNCVSIFKHTRLHSAPMQNTSFEAKFGFFLIFSSLFLNIVSVFDLARVSTRIYLILNQYKIFIFSRFHIFSQSRMPFHVCKHFVLTSFNVRTFRGQKFREPCIREIFRFARIQFCEFDLMKYFT